MELKLLKDDADSLIQLTRSWAAGSDIANAPQMAEALAMYLTRVYDAISELAAGAAAASHPKLP